MHCQEIRSIRFVAALVAATRGTIGAVFQVPVTFQSRLPSSEMYAVVAVENGDDAKIRVAMGRFPVGEYILLGLETPAAVVAIHWLQIVSQLVLLYSPSVGDSICNIQNNPANFVTVKVVLMFYLLYTQTLMAALTSVYTN